MLVLSIVLQLVAISLSGFIVWLAAPFYQSWWTAESITQFLPLLLALIPLLLARMTKQPSGDYILIIGIFSLFELVYSGFIYARLGVQFSWLTTIVSLQYVAVITAICSSALYLRELIRLSEKTP